MATNDVHPIEPQAQFIRQGSETAPPHGVAADRHRAILVAKALVRAPNIDAESDVGLLARMFLRECGIS